MADIFLHMIVPETITDSVFTSSSVPETDYAAWATATAYIVGDTRIMVSANIHWVIQCIQAHTSTTGSANDPLKDINRVSGAGLFWLRVSATNKWKVTDQKISDQCAFVGSIDNLFTAPKAAMAAALFNLTANSVTVTVTNPATGLIRTARTRTAIDDATVVDWYSYFYAPIEYRSEILLPDLPIYSGDTVRFEVYGLPTNKVGQIIFGRDITIGKGLFPAGVGIIDYSTKDTDTFGNRYITPRAFASRAEYKAVIASNEANRVKKQLAAVRSTPVVFYTHTIDNLYGTMVYGYVKSFDINEIAPSVAYVSIQVEGLT